MHRQQMLRDGAREMLDIILFFGLETKGQIRASVDGMTRKLLDIWEPVIRADELADLSREIEDLADEEPCDCLRCQTIARVLVVIDRRLGR